MSDYAFIDQYDAMQADADRIEREADARFEHLVAPLNAALNAAFEEARERYFRACDPLNDMVNREYDRAEQIRAEASTILRDGQKAADADHNAFVQSLLNAGSEEEVIKILKKQAQSCPS